jgi:hypothetical protein
VSHRYKILNHRGESPLVGGSPGFAYPYRKWTEGVTPRLCRSGYHLTDPVGCLDYVNDDYRWVHEFEVRGQADAGFGKTACESVRRVRRVGRCRRRLG